MEFEDWVTATGEPGRREIFGWNQLDYVLIQPDSGLSHNNRSMLKNVLIFSLIICLLILSGDEAEAQELFTDLVPCVYCSAHQRSQDGENPQDSQS